MSSLERITDMLNGKNEEILRVQQKEVAEIRLRSGREMRLCLTDGSEAVGEMLDEQIFRRIINRLMDDSLYSRENELKQGYFTTSDGFRVGICGKVNAGAAGIDCLANIGSACIRVPREVPGCAKFIIERFKKEERYGVLIVSPPGLGKTTLMRDYIRMLSDGGMNVCLADERREIACCMEGIPQLQVGCRTDVLDAGPKALALTMMIRSCAPDLVAVDEIGSEADAAALHEAARCGVIVAATAHGRSLKDVCARKHIASLIGADVFDWFVLLGPKRGQIQNILPLYDRVDGKVSDVQGNTAGVGTVGQYMCGANAFKCAQKKV